MLEGKYNFKESEPKWQKFWQDEGVYKFDKNSNKPIYSIDTPPPTVSGKIHMGHIFSYSQAEFIARFKRMNGFNVFYPFGFDDNGLPTERLVEKENNLKAYQVSREEFTQLCLKTAARYEEDFKKLFISAGNSADWSLQYSTVSPNTQKISQRSFLDLYKKGHLYYGERPALWCTECHTSIAQAELESKDLPSMFNYMKFYISGTEDYLEIATTRPELLCACCCVFVNPEDERFAHLVGKKVRVPLYDFEVEVMTDEKASIDKGSGAVMCCTFGDLTDLEWYTKHKLPYKEGIDSEGRMTSLAGKYEGLKIKQARAQIIEDLKNAGLILKQEELTHAVAVHERCGTPMEINIKKQWFIDILSHKEKFLELGEQVKWYPSFMKSRYTNWVENLEWDWCISRQKYFGVPFPVWYCKDCGEIIVASDDELPVNPITTMPKHACPKCGGNSFVPESDVMDTWATSSITPLLNTKWTQDEELYSKVYPMSLRPNAHDIIRTWDFYTIVKGFYHTEKLPWDNIMVSGFVLADKGEKISKSKQNSKLDPLQTLQNYSADTTRYWATTGSLGRDIILSDDEFKNGAKLINKIWNASKFVLSFLQDYKPEKCDLLPMDRWAIKSFNTVLSQFKDYFEKYEIGLAMGTLEKYFWNFCDNYIEIAKNRLYKPEIYGEKAKESAQFACYHVLLGMLKCFGIYMPHITEEIYQSYFAEKTGIKSLHLNQLDEIECECEIDLQKAEEVVEIVSEVRKYKSENKISLKTIITELDITTKINDFVKQCESDIKAVGTIEKINYKDGEFKVEVKGIRLEEQN